MVLHSKAARPPQAVTRAEAAATLLQVEAAHPKGLFDKEQLVKDVLAAAAAYPTEQLEKMWDYKSYVMEQVKASKGGNDYPRHRA